MKLSYDSEADVFGLQLSDAPRARTAEQGLGVLVGYDRAGRVTSVQVLDASKQFAAHDLALLKPPIIHLSLAEASRESGLAATTLRVLLNSGRLKGLKRGRDWFVTAANLDNYLESRAPSGRPAATMKARQNHRGKQTGSSRDASRKRPVTRKK